jgi:hypothetical protein
MATSTTSNDLPPWLLPLVQDYMGRAQDVANTPYQQSPGTYTAPNSTLQTAWEAITSRALNGSPVMDAANKQLTNTINGGGFNNPYLTDQVRNAQGDLTKAWNNVQAPQFDKMMAGSGSFGNSGVAQYAGMAAGDLQRNLARISTDMRGNAYNTERSNQMAATMAAPTFAQNDYLDANALVNVGNQQQTFNQSATNQNNKWWEEAQNYAGNQLDAYGRRLGVSSGGGTQTTTTPDPSNVSQIVGGAITGAQILPWFKDLWKSDTTSTGNFNSWLTDWLKT